MYKKSREKEGKPLPFWCQCVKAMTSPEALRNHIWNALQRKEIFDSLPTDVASAIRDCAVFIRYKIEETTRTLPRILERELRFPDGERWNIHLPAFLAVYEETAGDRRKALNGTMQAAVRAMAEGHTIADRALQICERLNDIPACRDALQKTYTMEEVVAYEALSPDQSQAKILFEKLVASINLFHSTRMRRRPPVDMPPELGDRINELFFAIQGFMYGRKSEARHTLASLTADVADIEATMAQVLGE
jgi:hypothetical protein